MGGWVMVGDDHAMHNNNRLLGLIGFGIYSTLLIPPQIVREPGGIGASLGDYGGGGF